MADPKYSFYTMEGIKYLASLVKHSNKVEEVIDDVGTLSTNKVWSSQHMNDKIVEMEENLKTYVEDKLKVQLKSVALPEMPEVEDMEENIIYLIEVRVQEPVIDEVTGEPVIDETTGEPVMQEVIDHYEQIMLVEGSRVSLGTTKIDLSSYYTIEETDEKFVKKEELINTFTGTEGDKIVNEDGEPVLDAEGNEQFGQLADGIPLSQKAIVDLYNMLKEMIGRAEVKVGTVTAFAGNTCPENYLFCQGQSLLKADYPELFAVIGTTYGGTSTSTTFNLPDLRGRVPVGVDPDWAVSDIFDGLDRTGGEVEHVLTSNEMPRHNHTGNTTQTLRRLTSIFDSISYNSLPSESGYILYTTYQSFSYSNSTNTAFSDSVHPGVHLKNSSGDNVDIRGVMVNAGNSSLSINYTGGGAAHNNCQPYITLQYIIKVK